MNCQQCDILQLELNSLKKLQQDFSKVKHLIFHQDEQLRVCESNKVKATELSSENEALRREITELKAERLRFQLSSSKETSFIAALKKELSAAEAKIKYLEKELENAEKALAEPRVASKGKKGDGKGKSKDDDLLLRQIEQQLLSKQSSANTTKDTLLAETESSADESVSQPPELTDNIQPSKSPTISRKATTNKQPGNEDDLQSLDSITGLSELPFEPIGPDQVSERPKFSTRTQSFTAESATSKSTSVIGKSSSKNTELLGKLSVDAEKKRTQADLNKNQDRDTVDSVDSCDASGKAISKRVARAPKKVMRSGRSATCEREKPDRDESGSGAKRTGKPELPEKGAKGSEKRVVKHLRGDTSRMVLSSESSGSSSSDSSTEDEDKEPDGVKDAEIKAKPSRNFPAKEIEKQKGSLSPAVVDENDLSYIAANLSDDSSDDDGGIVFAGQKTEVSRTSEKAETEIGYEVNANTTSLESAPNSIPETFLEVEPTSEIARSEEMATVDNDMAKVSQPDSTKIDIGDNQKGKTCEEDHIVVSIAEIKKGNLEGSKVKDSEIEREPNSGEANEGRANEVQDRKLTKKVSQSEKIMKQPERETNNVDNALKEIAGCLSSSNAITSLKEIEQLESISEDLDKSGSLSLSQSDIEVSPTKLAADFFDSSLVKSIPTTPGPSSQNEEEPKSPLKSIFDPFVSDNLARNTSCDSFVGGLLSLPSVERANSLLVENFDFGNGSLWFDLSFDLLNADDIAFDLPSHEAKSDKESSSSESFKDKIESPGKREDNGKVSEEDVELEGNVEADLQMETSEKHGLEIGTHSKVDPVSSIGEICSPVQTKLENDFKSSDSGYYQQTGKSLSGKEEPNLSTVSLEEQIVNHSDCTVDSASNFSSERKRKPNSVDSDTDPVSLNLDDNYRPTSEVVLECNTIPDDSEHAMAKRRKVDSDHILPDVEANQDTSETLSESDFRVPKMPSIEQNNCDKETSCNETSSESVKDSESYNETSKTQTKSKSLVSEETATEITSSIDPEINIEEKQIKLNAVKTRNARAPQNILAVDSGNVNIITAEGEIKVLQRDCKPLKKNTNDLQQPVLNSRETLKPKPKRTSSRTEEIACENRVTNRRGKSTSVSPPVVAPEATVHPRRSPRTRNPVELVLEGFAIKIGEDLDSVEVSPRREFVVKDVPLAGVRKSRRIQQASSVEGESSDDERPNKSSKRNSNKVKRGQSKEKTNSKTIESVKKEEALANQNKERVKDVETSMNVSSKSPTRQDGVGICSLKTAEKRMNSVDTIASHAHEVQSEIENHSEISPVEALTSGQPRAKGRPSKSGLANWKQGDKAPKISQPIFGRKKPRSAVVSFVSEAKKQVAKTFESEGVAFFKGEKEIGGLEGSENSCVQTQCVESLGSPAKSTRSSRNPQKAITKLPIGGEADGCDDVKTEVPKNLSVSCLLWKSATPVENKEYDNRDSAEIESSDYPNSNSMHIVFQKADSISDMHQQSSILDDESGNLNSASDQNPETMTDLIDSKLACSLALRSSGAHETTGSMKDKNSPKHADVSANAEDETEQLDLNSDEEDEQTLMISEELCGGDLNVISNHVTNFDATNGASKNNEILKNSESLSEIKKVSTSELNDSQSDASESESENRLEIADETPDQVLDSTKELEQSKSPRQHVHEMCTPFEAEIESVSNSSYLSNIQKTTAVDDLSTSKTTTEETLLESSPKSLGKATKQVRQSLAKKLSALNDDNEEDCHPILCDSPSLKLPRNKIIKAKILELSPCGDEESETPIQVNWSKKFTLSSQKVKDLSSGSTPERAFLRNDASKKNPEVKLEALVHSETSMYHSVPTDISPKSLKQQIKIDPNESISSIESDSNQTRSNNDSVKQLLKLLKTLTLQNVQCCFEQVKAMIDSGSMSVESFVIGVFQHLSAFMRSKKTHRPTEPIVQLTTSLLSECGSEMKEELLKRILDRQRTSIMSRSPNRKHLLLWVVGVLTHLISTASQSGDEEEETKYLSIIRILLYDTVASSKSGWLEVVHAAFSYVPQLYRRFSVENGDPMDHSQSAHNVLMTSIESVVCDRNSNQSIPSEFNHLFCELKFSCQSTPYQVANRTAYNHLFNQNFMSHAGADDTFVCLKALSLCLLNCSDSDLDSFLASFVFTNLANLSSTAHSLVVKAEAQIATMETALVHAPTAINVLGEVALKTNQKNMLSRNHNWLLVVKECLHRTHSLLQENASNHRTDTIRKLQISCCEALVKISPIDVSLVTELLRTDENAEIVRKNDIKVDHRHHRLFTEAPSNS